MNPIIPPAVWPAVIPVEEEGLTAPEEGVDGKWTGEANSAKASNSSAFNLTANSPPWITLSFKELKSSKWSAAVIGKK